VVILIMSFFHEMLVPDMQCAVRCLLDEATRLMLALTCHTEWALRASLPRNDDAFVDACVAHEYWPLLDFVQAELRREAPLPYAADLARWLHDVRAVPAEALVRAIQRRQPALAQRWQCPTCVPSVALDAYCQCLEAGLHPLAVHIARRRRLDTIPGTVVFERAIKHDCPAFIDTAALSLSKQVDVAIEAIHHGSANVLRLVANVLFDPTCLPVYFGRHDWLHIAFRAPNRRTIFAVLFDQGRVLRRDEVVSLWLESGGSDREECVYMTETHGGGFTLALWQALCDASARLLHHLLHPAFAESLKYNKRRLHDIWQCFIAHSVSEAKMPNL
jgi:hypothetical protein